MEQYFPRIADEALDFWRTTMSRKPLVLRGPRQVGKSSLVRQLGTRYEHFIELNLERERDRRLFDTLPEVAPFLELVFARQRISPAPDDSVLLFIDEIQQAPQAIQFLRYLYEDQDCVQVIAAGSLLEFAFGEVRSLPVGRVEFMSVYPLCFEEYLRWHRQDALVKAIHTVPAPVHLHDLLVEAFRDYTLKGGMPEIVKRSAAGEPLAALQTTYASIWDSYRIDLERHAKSDAERKVLRFLLQAAPREADRFAYAGFGGSNYRSREVKEAFELLEMARVLRVVHPTSDLEAPALPKQRAKPRLQFLDTGLLNFASGLHEALAFMPDANAAYRGRLALHVVTQELIATQTGFEPYFWIRENSNSNAEVDLVFRHGMELLPVEVKSGPQGKLRSLHQFVERAQGRLGVRVLENTASIEAAQTSSAYAYTLLNVPIYAISQLPAYVQWGMQRVVAA